MSPAWALRGGRTTEKAKLEAGTATGWALLPLNIWEKDWPPSTVFHQTPRIRPTAMPGPRGCQLSVPHSPCPIQTGGENCRNLLPAAVGGGGGGAEGGGGGPGLQYAQPAFAKGRSAPQASLNWTSSMPELPHVASAVQPRQALLLWHQSAAAAIVRLAACMLPPASVPPLQVAPALPPSAGGGLCADTSTSWPTRNKARVLPIITRASARREAVSVSR